MISTKHTDQESVPSLNETINGSPYTHGKYIPMQDFTPERESNPRVFKARRVAGRLQFDTHDGWIDAPPKFTLFYC